MCVKVANSILHLYEEAYLVLLFDVKGLRVAGLKRSVDSSG